MAKLDLHGIFPPIATPFIKGKVAYDKLRPLLGVAGEGIVYAWLRQMFHRKMYRLSFLLQKSLARIRKRRNNHRPEIYGTVNGPCGMTQIEGSFPIPVKIWARSASKS